MMKRKRKQRQNEPAAPLPQLCLFNEQQMDAMIEQKPVKPADPLPVPVDPGQLQWQLMVWAALRGQAWRQNRAMLIGSKKEKTRPGSVATWSLW